MNYNIHNILLFTIFGFIFVCQLIFSAFIINKKDQLSEILYNYKNITECKNDSIYRLKNGSLIDNTMAILVSSFVIISSYVLIIFNKYILRTKYKLLNQDDISIKTQQIINIDKYNLTIDIIFIMAILCFVISSGIQFIFQLENISDICLQYINIQINNFFIIYKFMICTTFAASYALLFLIPCLW